MTSMYKIHVRKSPEAGHTLITLLFMQAAYKIQVLELYLLLAETYKICKEVSTYQSARTIKNKRRISRC